MTLVVSCNNRWTSKVIIIYIQLYIAVYFQGISQIYEYQVMPSVKSSFSQMAAACPNNVTKSLFITAGKTLRSMFLFHKSRFLFVANVLFMYLMQKLQKFSGKLSSAENQYAFIDTVTKFQIELMTRFWELRVAICSSFSFRISFKTSWVDLNVSY